MPLFDFKCPSCAKVTERLQRHDDAAPSCASCAKVMERQVGRTSFKLRGYSWGTNGYANRPPWDLAPPGED